MEQFFIAPTAGSGSLESPGSTTGGGAGHDKQVRVAAARGREEELKGNYRKRQRADIHRVSRGQAPKGPLPPEEWDVPTPSLTPGQAAAGGVEVAVGGVETAAGG